MNRKGRKHQDPSSTKLQVSTNLDPEVVARIEEIAETQNKSRALVMVEIITAGLPILERRKWAMKKIDTEEFKR